MTLRPASSGVNSIWQDRRELSCVCDSSDRSSRSSDMGSGTRSTQAGSMYTWQVAQEHMPPQMAATP